MAQYADWPAIHVSIVRRSTDIIRSVDMRGGGGILTNIWQGGPRRALDMEKIERADVWYGGGVFVNLFRFLFLRSSFVTQKASLKWRCGGALFSSPFCCSSACFFLSLLWRGKGRKNGRIETPMSECQVPASRGPFGEKTLQVTMSGRSQGAVWNMKREQPPKHKKTL